MHQNEMGTHAAGAVFFTRQENTLLFGVSKRGGAAQDESVAAVNLDMNNHNNRTMPFDIEDPCFAEARALAASVMAIRRARGQTKPSEHEAGSTAGFIVSESFARDVMRMLMALDDVEI
jgi:hypothetical protein